jgi:predicted RNase H-like nuclease
MVVAGVDGCKAGWLAIQLYASGSWCVKVFRDAASLWRELGHAELILIDIPIGLPDRSTRLRRCDQEARLLLGQPRVSTVFPPPSRAALDARTYKDSCNQNLAEVGKKLSCQSYNIAKKIKQIDELMRRDAIARQQIRETHPELCFRAFNNCHAMQYGKKTNPGFRERLRVLRRVLPRSQDIIDYALGAYPRREVAKDDILDALVAAATALRPEQLVSIPEDAQSDSSNLRMEIVYAQLETRPG